MPKECETARRGSIVDGLSNSQARDPVFVLIVVITVETNNYGGAIVETIWGYLWNTLAQANSFNLRCSPVFTNDLGTYLGHCFV